MVGQNYLGVAILVPIAIKLVLGLVPWWRTLGISAIRGALSVLSLQAARLLQLEEKIDLPDWDG